MNALNLSYDKLPLISIANTYCRVVIWNPDMSVVNLNHMSRMIIIHTFLSHNGARFIRTPLKNILATMVDSTVDDVIIIILRQK